MKLERFVWITLWICLIGAQPCRQAVAAEDDHKGHKHAAPAADGVKNQKDATSCKDDCKDHQRAASARPFCGEHNLFEDECGTCHPELLAGLKPGQGLKVRLASAEAAKTAGIGTARPGLCDTCSEMTVLARLAYNQNALARITSLVSGVVKKVHADLGARVSKGDVLAEIISTEIARLKADHLTALANERLKETVFKREKDLAAKRISPQQEYQQAAAEYETAKTASLVARQQLLNYGLTEEEVREVEQSGSTSSVLLLRAPFDGTIVERTAVVGEAAAAGVPFFTLADLSTFWLELSIPEDQLAQFKTGDPVEATFDGLEGLKVRGQLTWLDTGIDPQTRTLKARATVPNERGAAPHEHGALKNGMFGQVRLVSAHPAKRLYVPADAVQRINGGAFVVVKLAGDLYEVRRVKTGPKDDKGVDILEGVSPQDDVVVAGGFTLRSELLKSRLGAGCAD